MDCLREELAETITFDDHQAGMLLTARLPDQYDDIQIAEAAQTKSIYVSALSKYYAGKNRQRGLLISFCLYESQEIIENTRELRRILSRYS